MDANKQKCNREYRKKKSYIALGKKMTEEIT